MPLRISLLLSLVFLGCQPTPLGSSAPSTLAFSNNTNLPTTIYMSFGSDSAITAPDWAPTCRESAKLNCDMSIPAGRKIPLPVNGKRLNVTVSYDSPVGCGSTKAEININNPKWYDIIDISLVDGYSNKIQVSVNDMVLGPPLGAQGNEKVLGVYPLGCDICTGRENPPDCSNLPPRGTTTGCKAGTQYKPDVPCHWQGTTFSGGGSAINVQLVP